MVSEEAVAERSDAAINSGLANAAPAEASLAQFDPQSASRLLRIVIVFAWLFAGAALASALLGFGVAAVKCVRITVVRGLIGCLAGMAKDKPCLAPLCCADNADPGSAAVVLILVHSAPG